MPPEVLAALVLATTPLRFLVVGTAALWLHGEEDVVVHDLDVVPDPSSDNLGQVRPALLEVGTPSRFLPSTYGLSSLDLISVPTAYGPVDLLLERGRVDYEHLRAAGTTLTRCGVDVSVASVSDTLRLRAIHKEVLP